jgi:hypothetical protein
MENWSKHFGDREYVSITDLLALEAKSNARAERLQKTGTPSDSVHLGLSLFIHSELQAAALHQL